MEVEEGRRGRGMEGGEERERDGGRGGEGEGWWKGAKIERRGYD